MNKLLAALAQVWPRLPAGGAACAAVSGGLDSMALLHALARYRERHDPARALRVLHVNHNLRGAESDGDEALVRDECARLGVPLLVKRLEWNTRPTQALCRAARNEFFGSEMGPEDRLFLAHHLDDQAETVFLRLMRGSGLRGLRAMEVERGNTLRPFLPLRRRELEAAVVDAGIAWREDASNKNNRYERNWLRNEILPLLEARRPGFAGKLSALAAEAALLPVARVNFSVHAVEGGGFYRAAELKQASTASISAAFRLSRLHAKGLEALLKKGAGNYSAEGVGFRLSAGVLLAGVKPFSPRVEWREERGIWVASNPLGEWRVVPEVGEKLGFVRGLSLGEKAKKEFQQKKVPIFFREMVPLRVRGGRAEALLPGSARAEIELSPLGQWWINPS